MAPYHYKLLLIFSYLLIPTISLVIQCPDCGNTPVPYPLSTSTTCGDQSYKIRCNENDLIFDTLNNSYPITSVDALNQRLVIRPSDILPNTCVSYDFVYRGIQLNSSLPFNITSSNTVMLFNCSITILDQPLDCSDTSLCRSYVNSMTMNEHSQCQNAELCCTFKAGGSASAHAIRVREDGCRAYRSFVNLDPDQPVDSWAAPAVELQWVQPEEPICRSQVDCDENSNCEVNPEISMVSRCYCETGLLRDTITGICFQVNKCQSSGGCGKSKKVATIAGLACSLAAFLTAIVAGTMLYIRHKRIKDARNRLARERKEHLSADGSKVARLFTAKEIKKATKNLSKDSLIGSGGFGEVYKGTLDDGTVVAIKCAKLGNPKGGNQILNEVRILCQVNHRNLVRMLGCCVELEEPILVYEFVQNGTLLDHLSGKSKLSLIDRLQIAHDTAECLSYLHASATPPIYHRDIKSSNILLDDNLNAKVSDFGLSRLVYTDLSHISTCAQGTIGYLDPEYFRKFQLTDKSDVYSFGVVLLELVTSLKAVDTTREEDDMNLTIYVQRRLKEDKLMEVIDPLLKQDASVMELDSIDGLVHLALDCLEEKRENRPSMKQVADEIEYISSYVAMSN
ncbi:Protein kinase family protein [Euphorbia peplus]|nr:Protein kinase family protein [Euphorbia peplus]